jgi:hypothetical protein
LGVGQIDGLGSFAGAKRRLKMKFVFSFVGLIS